MIEDKVTIALTLKQAKKLSWQLRNATDIGPDSARWKSAELHELCKIIEKAVSDYVQELGKIVEESVSDCEPSLSLKSKVD